MLSAGLATTSIGSYDRAFASFLDSTGNIVVAGDAGVSGSQDFAVLRYSANGTLDASFGQGGVVTTPASRGADGAHATVPYDDKILVAGSGTWPVKGVAQTDFLLARYNANGSLDTTFGSSGIVRTDLGQSDTIDGLAVDRDGYIIAAGRVHNFNPSSKEVVVARYTPQGALDWIVHTGIIDDSFGPTVTMRGEQHDKILLVGTCIPTVTSNDTDIFLAQYNLDGTLDTSFVENGSGKVISDVGGILTAARGEDYQWEYAHAVAVDASGRIVVGGEIGGELPNNVGRQDFLVARYNPDGSRDTTFGFPDLADETGTKRIGAVVNDLGPYYSTDPGPYDLSVVNAIAVRSDKSILAGGFAGGYGRFAVASYNEERNPRSDLRAGLDESG